MSNLYTVRTPEVVPASEVSQDFLEKMANRMVVSFFKYGKAADAYPHKVDAIRSLIERLERYAGAIEDVKAGKPSGDGNTEWLVDVANFAMIEFTHPRHPQAHFRSTDSDESPGRVRLDGADPQAKNM